MLRHMHGRREIPLVLPPERARVKLEPVDAATALTWSREMTEDCELQHAKTRARIEQLEAPLPSLASYEEPAAAQHRYRKPLNKWHGRRLRGWGTRLVDDAETGGAGDD